MVHQQLTDELVEAAVHTIAEQYRFWGKQYKKGIVAKAECYQRMEASFHENFWKLIRDHHLRLCISEANFPHFCMEFERYAKGDVSDHPAPLPWLYDIAEGKMEASLHDRRLFFSLMKKLSLTPDYFEPLPENIPHFTLNQIHQYIDAAIYWTAFRCVDDDGLLADANPIGKTFRLKNEYGLCAVVTIVSEDKPSRETDSRTPAEWKATGYMEGYTAVKRTCNPEITISVGNDRALPWRLTFWEDANDLNARNAFPLWQEYFRQCDAKTKKHHSILFPVFDAYMKLEG